ncbi:hypothetical protein BTA51_03750 [Hahella sp. CCB-MM4]|uniref:hypothetical protein n=1 Tax=Hahella sp. (strain CCB-MM4) TaxID=1926491 RepID=UPI000B9B0223|nr:hypothetical protein [Hahella sp. CCB-MM4]OZG74148.1 hypothetical protein BTA51_03750 [Hahella sp. CCB-MM4]
MQPIFANSSIGTDSTTVINDVTRTGLNCATAAELANCNFVRTDGISFVVLGGVKFGLAHVRVNSQVANLDKLKALVGGNIDVYMVGGFGLQPGPADSIIAKYTSNRGRDLAAGVNQVYAHVKKTNSFLAGRTDASGHVTGFVATVGASNYRIGTHSLLGCVGVLVVPQGTAVVMKKIHLYDATNTVGAIGAYNTNTLTTQVF